MVVDGHQSREAAVTSGVPQGTVLGPLFFLVYINDIQRNISSKLRLFADDSLLYRQITKPEDEDILQSDINKLLEWAKLWQMNFNIAKCHTLRIRISIRGSKDQTLPVRKYYMEGNSCLMLSTIHISVLSSIVRYHGTYTWLTLARNQYMF